MRDVEYSQFKQAPGGFVRCRECGRDLDFVRDSGHGFGCRYAPVVGPEQERRAESNRRWIYVMQVAEGIVNKGDVDQWERFTKLVYASAITIERVGPKQEAPEAPR